MCSHDDYRLDLKLADGRTLSAPLWWYPRPIGPTPAARDSIELMPTSRHWPKIDKDISIASMQQRPQASGAMR